MQKKLYSLAVIITALLLFTGLSSYAASNGAGNVANGGYAVSDGKYVYYGADGVLYRENIGGGNKKTLMENGSVDSLWISGNNLYYEDINYLGGCSLNRIGTDGSNDEYLGGCHNSAYTQIDNGYIYYLGKNEKIRKRKIGSDDYTEIASTNGAFIVYRGKIYFNNIDKSSGGTGLASIDLNGGSFQSYLVGTAFSINLYDDFIYYTKNDEIKRIPISGGSEETIFNESGWYINVYNDYIYFRDEGGKLARVSIGGGSKETSSAGVYSYFCIVENKVYSRNPDNYSKVTIFDLPAFQPGANSSEKTYICSDWADETITKAANNELIPGYFTGKDLTETITRDEFAAVAVKLYEKLANTTVSAASTPFNDISGSSLKNEIGKAYKLNIAIGVSDTEFEPKTDLNREQLATMLCRVIKKYKFPKWNMKVDGEYHMGGASGRKFADDEDISDFARDSVYFMSSVGIINGIGDNKFAPKNTTSSQEAIGYADATREQAIVIAERIYETSDMF